MGLPLPSPGPPGCSLQGLPGQGFPSVSHSFFFFCLVLLDGLLGLDLDFGSAIPSPVCACVLSMPFSNCLQGSTILGRDKVHLMKEK